jgi:hypothetical protein
MDVRLIVNRPAGVHRRDAAWEARPNLRRLRVQATEVNILWDASELEMQGQPEPYFVGYPWTPLSIARARYTLPL